MKNDYFITHCKCGETIKAPKEFPEVDALLKWRQFICQKCSKPHTFDYHRMKWLR